MGDFTGLTHASIEQNTYLGILLSPENHLSKSETRQTKSWPKKSPPTPKCPKKTAKTSAGIVVVRALFLLSLLRKSTSSSHAMQDTIMTLSSFLKRQSHRPGTL